MALRAIPRLRVIRPADANEVPQAWRVHIDGDGPTAIILTRQNVPVLEGTAERAPEGLPTRRVHARRRDRRRALDLVLIGTGSEVQLCVAAREQLEADGLSVRVVSMPSWELFAEQPDEYRDDVLPPGVPTLAVEAGASLGWDRYADDVIAIDRFGASAPGDVVLAELGFTPENVVARARALLALDSPGGKAAMTVTSSPIARLVEYGQSPWYDNLTRDLVTGGGLAALIEDDGIRGVTSNPTIFEKAMAAARATTSSSPRWPPAGPPIDSTYWALVLDDIRAAADVLRPIYDALDGADGFVSVEVSPDLAHDTAATIEQATGCTPGWPARTCW